MREEEKWKVAHPSSFAIVAMLLALSPALPATARGGEVPLLEQLYPLDAAVTTNSAKARAYFNQGLVLTYGFDHADAEVSFLEAAKVDPGFAMAYWGAAFVLGPNINAPMDDGDVPRAYELSRKALSLVSSASATERDLVEALAKRYGPAPVKDRFPLDAAFAEAMRGVYGTHGGDPNVAVLFAESLMDLHPWDYWTAEGEARPWTAEIRGVLEKVMRDHPRHPQAHHLFIHLMENSPTPEVTVKSADVIGTLVPLSGHLVHMASHAYYAAGLYHDCSSANEDSLGVDRLLTSSFDTGGLYRLAYVPHNLHFLLACYMMEGRSEEAVATARRLAGGIDPAKMREPGLGTLQHYYASPYYALARFGRWEQILAEPPPAEDLVYPRAMLHYARGMALVRRGEKGKAAGELESLRSLAADPSLEPVTIWDLNKVSDLLAIAAEVLAGELAGVDDSGEALAHLERAVTLEERLTYDEPPPWYYPARESLGALLLDLGRAKEAERVFRRDLARNAENPFSLFGWAKSLEAQGNTDLLPDVQKRFRRAWSRADVPMTRPVF